MKGDNNYGASLSSGEFTTAAEFESIFVFRYRKDGVKVIATYYSGHLPYEEKHYNPEMDLLDEDFKRIVESIRMTGEDFEQEEE